MPNKRKSLRQSTLSNRTGVHRNLSSDECENEAPPTVAEDSGSKEDVQESSRATKMSSKTDSVQSPISTQNESAGSLGDQSLVANSAESRARPSRNTQGVPRKIYRDHDSSPEESDDDEPKVPRSRSTRLNRPMRTPAPDDKDENFHDIADLKPFLLGPPSKKNKRSAEDEDPAYEDKSISLPLRGAKAQLRLDKLESIFNKRPIITREQAKVLEQEYGSSCDRILNIWNNFRREYMRKFDSGEIRLDELPYLLQVYEIAEAQDDKEQDFLDEATGLKTGNVQIFTNYLASRRKQRGARGSLGPHLALENKLSPEQETILSEKFRDWPFPSYAEIRHMARKVDATDIQIAYWFEKFACKEIARINLEWMELPPGLNPKINELRKWDAFLIEDHNLADLGVPIERVKPFLMRLCQETAKGLAMKTLELHKIPRDLQLLEREYRSCPIVLPDEARRNYIYQLSELGSEEVDYWFKERKYWDRKAGVNVDAYDFEHPEEGDQESFPNIPVGNVGGPGISTRSRELLETNRRLAFGGVLLRDVHLPYDNDYHFRGWTHEQVLEWASQFFSFHSYLILAERKVDGKQLIRFNVKDPFWRVFRISFAKLRKIQADFMEMDSYAIRIREQQYSHRNNGR